jgi:hypothetical protein
MNRGVDYGWRAPHGLSVRSVGCALNSSSALRNAHSIRQLFQVNVIVASVTLSLW